MARIPIARPKEIYREGYRKGALVFYDDLPERLPYMMEEGWKIESIEVRAAGKMNDGREFQDVRIYTKEKK